MSLASIKVQSVVIIDREELKDKALELAARGNELAAKAGNERWRAETVGGEVNAVDKELHEVRAVAAFIGWMLLEV